MKHYTSGPSVQEENGPYSYYNASLVGLNMKEIYEMPSGYTDRPLLRGLYMSAQALTSRILHECSFIIEFIKRVGKMLLLFSNWFNKFNNTGA